MAVGKRSELAADLVEASERFVAWRRTKQPLSRIPRRLWALAVKLAGKHGLHRTASTLKLDYYSLKKRIEQAELDRSSQESAFVEVVAEPQADGDECVIELEDGAAARLRMTLKGHGPPDVSALARGFWNAD